MRAPSEGQDAASAPAESTARPRAVNPLPPPLAPPRRALTMGPPARWRSRANRYTARSLEIPTSRAAATTERRRSSAARRETSSGVTTSSCPAIVDPGPPKRSKHESLAGGSRTRAEPPRGLVPGGAGIGPMRPDGAYRHHAVPTIDARGMAPNERLSRPPVAPSDRT